MQISFQCPNCSAKLKVPPAFLGTRKTCPLCKSKIEIPADNQSESLELPELPSTAISLLPPPIPATTPEPSPKRFEEPPEATWIRKRVDQQKKRRRIRHAEDDDSDAKPEQPPSEIWVLGLFLVFFGVLGAINFWMMDTSVPAGDHRVHNLGLMQQQSIGVMVSCVVIIIGAVVWIFKK